MENKIDLVKNRRSSFRIVRSRSASDCIIRLCELLQKTIENIAGVSLPIVTDTEPEQAYEILIGNTDRSVCRSLTLAEKEYCASVYADPCCVLLCGTDDIRTGHAFDHFLAKCIVPDENGDICLDTAFSVRAPLILTEDGEKGAALLSRIRTHRIPDCVCPNEASSLRAVTDIHMISAVTGEYSVNQTRSRFAVGGTDLGIIARHKEKMYLFFGDTMSGEKQNDDWRSNICAVTTDCDYRNGILFDTMIQDNDRDGFAKELVVGQKINHTEMTKIPTGVISLGDTLYMSFMSVNNWEAPQGWACNYGRIAKSTDDGKNWTVLENLTWPGDSKFCQMFPVIHPEDGLIYVYGITGGRRNIARLMRVAPEDYENFDAYEYLTGISEDGSPVFEKGTDAMMHDFAVLEGQNGELSIMYSEYLREWIAVRFIGDRKDIALSTAKKPWGPFTEPVSILTQKDIPGLYGGFMHPVYTSEDGKRVAMLVSVWLPVYNAVVMEMTLNK